MTGKDKIEDLAEALVLKTIRDLSPLHFDMEYLKNLFISAIENSQKP